MKVFAVIIVMLSTMNQAYSQNLHRGYDLVYHADSLFKAGNIKGAKADLTRAISELNQKAYAYKDLAKACIMLNEKSETQRYLGHAIQSGIDTAQLQADSTLRKFKTQAGFQDLYKRCRRAYNADLLYPDQRLELAQMVERDQAARDLVGVLKKEQADPIINSIDSANALELKSMVAKIGFPGYKEVGLDGVSNLFLLLLHITANNVNDDQEMSLFGPMMKSEVLKDNFSPIYYALIEDKYAFQKSKQQTYGTYWEFNPQTGKRVIQQVSKVEEVDSRRRQIYLPPLNSLGAAFVLPDNYHK